MPRGRVKRLLKVLLYVPEKQHHAFTLLSVLMDFERSINSDRSRQAYRDRTNRGLKNGGQILGYDRIPDKPGHLTINGEEAKIVRFFFREYLKLGSVHEVAAKANQRGYKTKTYESSRERKHEGRDFAYSTIKQILRNRVYIAENEIHKRNRNKRPDDVEEGREYRAIKSDKWKPIIDKATFDEVQDMLAKNGKAKSKPSVRNRNGHFLMADLLTCSHCDATLTHGGTTKNRTYHAYYNHRKGERSATCPLPANLPGEKLDAAIWDRLVHEVQIDDKLQEYMEQYQKDSVPKHVTELEADIEELKRIISERQKEHDDLLKALGKEKDDAGARVASLLKTMSDDIDDMTTELEEKRCQLEEAKKRAVVKTRVGSLLKNRKKGLAKLPAADRVELAKILLKRVVLNPDSIILERRVGQPIVGVLREFRRKDGKPVLSKRWRFVNVEWLG